MRELIPQSQLKRYHQLGLEPNDIRKAVQKLIEAAADRTHEIKELQDIRLL